MASTSTKPLDEILRETATGSDSESDDAEEIWTDAHEEIPIVPLPAPSAQTKHEHDADVSPAVEPTSSGSHPLNTEYPEGIQPEDKFTDDEIRELLKKGDAIKVQGNDRFRASDWEGAIKLYQNALRTVPPRPSPPPLAKTSSKGKESDIYTSDDGPENGDGEDTSDIANGMTNNATNEEVPPALPPAELTELEKKCAAARAAINGNIAACYVKLNKHEEAVKICTEGTLSPHFSFRGAGVHNANTTFLPAALLDDTKHIKVLHRRATSNEEIGSWTSLSAAEKDYQALLPLLRPRSPLQPQISRSLRTLPSRIEVAKKKETDEMMGKLKDLGNTVLGKFGLSTDNFQFTPNGQGGYSMNFVR
ncbi:hypothetical protein FRB94_002539 [Tulasnella sp. JGI-2019a]|nr:hypothetical protein FRB94_002539 [Tulasnella sp. JGI-2019a]